MLEPSLFFLISSLFGLYFPPPTLYFLCKLIVLMFQLQSAWTSVDKTFHHLIKKFPFLDKVTFKSLPAMLLQFLIYLPPLESFFLNYTFEQEVN